MDKITENLFENLSSLRLKYFTENYPDFFIFSQKKDNYG